MMFTLHKWLPEDQNIVLETFLADNCYIEITCKYDFIYYWRKTVGGLKLTDLPGLEALQVPGIIKKKC